MPEQPYSVREIQALFKAADERADEYHSTLMGHMDSFEVQTSSALDRIEQQTRKTNGRVTALEGNLKIVAAVVAVVVILKFPEMISLLKVAGI